MKEGCGNGGPGVMRRNLFTHKRRTMARLQGQPQHLILFVFWERGRKEQQGCGIGVGRKWGTCFFVRREMTGTTATKGIPAFSPIHPLPV